MRVIMNVLAIAICQGVIRLDFSKNLHGKLPFLCPKTIKRQNLAPIVRYKIKNTLHGITKFNVIARSVATGQSASPLGAVPIAEMGNGFPRRPVAASE